jgi:hypothetical protein
LKASRLANLLNRLAREIEGAVGFVLPPGALRIAFQGLSIVRRVAFAARTERLSELEVRSFVRSLSAEYHEGKAFPGDLAFAALAVALERVPTSYAEEFLRDLASLNVREMITSIHVARECLKYR